MSKETYTSWDSAEFLGDDEVVVEYLRAALEENDPAFFVKAVGNVARAKGMSQVAQEAQLGRQNLYRSLSGEHDPQIGTLMKVLDSLGVQLTVAPSRREDVKKKEIHLMSFRDANGDPEALHRWKIRLLKELARLTGLNIKFDRVLRDKCLYRLDKIAEKVHITISDWNPDSERNPRTAFVGGAVASGHRRASRLFLRSGQQGVEQEGFSGFEQAGVGDQT